jgi:hypothetical protein
MNFDFTANPGPSCCHAPSAVRRSGPPTAAPGFWLFPKGWVSKVLICRFAYAGVVGGSQIGTESGRASRCMQQGGWVGGTLSFCMGSSVGQ